MTDIEEQILKNQASLAIALNALFLMQKGFATNRTAVSANAENMRRYSETLDLLEIDND